MTTPKDTWISVRDAMPPIETPEDYSLIGMDKNQTIMSIKYEEGRIVESRNYEILESIYFWMLLSKPKTNRMEENKVPQIENVTRLEVICHSDNCLEKGRSFTKYLSKNEVLRFSLQDDNKTLKIFIQNK